MRSRILRRRKKVVDQIKHKIDTHLSRRGFDDFAIVSIGSGGNALSRELARLYHIESLYLYPRREDLFYLRTDLQDIMRQLEQVKDQT